MDRRDCLVTELQQHALFPASHLFEGTPFDLVIRSMAAGLTLGRVWVDDASHPACAFAWDRGRRFYLGGRSDNAGLNGDLAGIIAEQIAPFALTPSIIYPAHGWDDSLSALFADRRLHQGLRCLYKFPRMSIPDWKVRIPNGFTVARIDDELLVRPDLVNVGRLLDEIRSMWNDETDFLSHGFGFCALEGDTVVSWCTAEYVSEGRCGIGIETVEEYQGLGLATLTASAFVGHCLQHDISPHWDTWCSNLPSVRVAEKVGFRTAAEYNVYVAE